MIIIYYYYHYYCYCCLEQLEELHRNLTREQLNNLKILRDQQQQISQWRDKEITDLNQIQKAQQAMWEQWSKHFEVIISNFFLRYITATTTSWKNRRAVYYSVCYKEKQVYYNSHGGRVI